MCFTRHVALPPHAATTMALWVIHSYVFDEFQISPILCLSSPEERCGKTTAMTILNCLCRKSLHLSNVTASTLYRLIDVHAPTLLIDDADSFLLRNVSLLGVLNSGHSKSGAFWIRTDGKKRDVRKFSTWCPKAVALMRALPETLMHKSIVIPMCRKLHTEVVEHIPHCGVVHAYELRAKCARWATDNGNALGDRNPVMPQSLQDRAQDNWFSLFAIADAVGGVWPLKARNAALALTPAEEDAQSASIQLLANARSVFDERAVGRISSEEMIESLVMMDERPWASWNHGSAITIRQLASLLKPFGIQPLTIRFGDRVLRGYDRNRFEDAFARYLSKRNAPMHEPKAES